MPRTQSLLSLLEAGFSDEELRTLLAEALLALDKAGLDALCSRLGEDTATTLRTMLSRLDDHPGERPAVSLDRIGQEWEEAWSAWDGIIEASGDQHGDFVEQENHWEPPCLDLYAIANGLDEVAGRLLPFVQHASDLEEAADFDLLAKVDEDLGNIGAGLPEWFGDVELGDVVGPRLTELVLRWEWHRGSKGTTPFAILDRIRRAECDSEGWTLDREALRGFVSRLPEAAQQEILRGLVEHGRMAHWAGVLTDAHSTWFPVYRELAQRWHPPVYLALCRDGISSDWSLAVPVLEDILARRAFAEADGVAASALDALLYLRGEKRWDPWDGLLVDQPGIRYRSGPDEPVPRFLDLLARIAEGRGDTEGAEVLDSQAFLLQHWDRWDRVAVHLDEVEDRGHARVADRFFGLWTTSVARRSAASGRGDVAVGWVPLIAASLRTGTEPYDAVASLRGWIERAGANPSEFRRHRSELEVLTRDLGLGGTAPALLRHLGTDDSRNAVSRGVVLRRLGCDVLVPMLRQTWIRFAALLVPDPADNHGSHYEEHAAWLAVVRELNPAACNEVMASWHSQHARRRNLWAALTSAGLV